MSTTFAVNQKIILQNIDPDNGAYLGECRIIELLGNRVHLVDEHGGFGSYDATQLEKRDRV